MAYDLPNRRRSKYVEADLFSESLSQSPTLSPTERTPNFGHDEQPKADVRKVPSFLTRTFGSSRSQPGNNNNNGSTGPLGLRSLFCAPEPLIDIIFVHGLRGGSIKTWRFEDDQELFWPQFWLPKEPEFASASIHSFGYDSDWGSTKPSFLNVQDFGRSLYEELLTSPLLRRSSKVSPIILIGHSMGGLVIKKAYTLAHEDPTQVEMSKRFQCIFFLATPHRGSDYAAVLNNVLKYCGIAGLTSSREFIDDLKTGSASTQLINNSFARYAHDLTIYSFCETLPTISGSSGLIVDKASAILGPQYKNEHIQYLRANHRNICKFRTKEESNYIILKNALATAVEDLIQTVSTTNDRASKEKMRAVQELLQINYTSEEHYERLEGSCQWIEGRDDFCTWITADFQANSVRAYRPSIFWVQAHPGAGKTVLATHVVSQLSHFRSPHASYFFHFGKKSAQSLAGLLRSLALQMASINVDIRERLAKIHDAETLFDPDDGRAVWQKIFIGGIFQVAVSMPQFWVIDAIDECVKYAELFTLLKDLRSPFPIRIFMTSRKLADMSRLTRMLDGCELNVVEIPASDTMRDIDLYVRSRVSDLPIDEEGERKELARQISAKSNTSFLWVKLVMDELEGVYGYDSIIQVLQGIPEGMVPYYARVVAEMGERKREQHVAKAILMWVMLATRPLSVSELSHALQLDINVHLPSAKAAIEGLCGHLVTVDIRTSMILPVHATAREFILSEEAGDFRVSKVQGHEKIALTCLRLLVGPDMQPPRHRRLLAQKRARTSTSALTDYAITRFSEHIVGTSTESDKLLMALGKFLKTSVLVWIEKIMIKKDIHCVIQTAKNLKGYLDRRAKYHSPLNLHVNTIEAWATDLSRIVSSFGRALVRNPTSVYFLIPPLCPTQSAMFQQFGKSPDGLGLSGYRRSNWSDCVTNIHLEDETAATIGCANNMIVVAMQSGKLEVYNSRSFQNDRFIDTMFPVDTIHFDPFGAFVAISSRKYVGIWEIDGKLRWQTRIRNRNTIMSSSQDVLIGITPQGRFYQWDLDTGELIHEQVYVYQSPYSDTNTSMGSGKAPSAACFSPGLELVALNYRNSPICIYECSTGSFIAWAIDEHNRAAEQLIFNPNPEVGLLLVAYNESHLALYDSWSGSLIESAEAESHVILNSVTCSPDGRTFATMDVQGHLRIWDFESLTLLYHVLTPASSSGLLQFTSDNLGLVQVRDHEIRVWAPPALVRKTIEEEASLSDQCPVLPVTEGQFENFQASKIRTLTAHPSSPLLFAGNQNGDVLMYQASTEYSPSILYSHDGTLVRHIAAGKHNAIASADLLANIRVFQFDASQRQISTKEPMLQVQFKSPVKQLLFDETGVYLLVSTLESDFVYNIENGSLIGSRNFPEDERMAWKWFVVSDADYQGHYLLMNNNTVTAFSIKDFPKAPKIVAKDLTIPVGPTIESITHVRGTLSVVVEIQQPSSRTLSVVVTLPRWSTLDLVPAIVPTSVILPDVCVQLLGVNQSSKRMVFLQPDSWVCSVDLKELDAAKYVEHFFVPEDYGSQSSNVRPVQIADEDFAFCMYDKVVVIKGGLKFQQERTIE
ncbi:hypothetical protein GQ44DRAFT_660589 [Phaeosphaeriaceae sp. PMI808]|nr:hypothetical protein GQ44DRAFT_660589 [Phaeosphaeriaceae sp. PMI808]